MRPGSLVSRDEVRAIFRSGGWQPVRQGIEQFRVWLHYRCDRQRLQLGKAVTKGGLRNTPDVQLLLGIAQLKGGHKDDAVKTFKTVKGDPTLERLANLWTLHARQA